MAERGVSLGGVTGGLRVRGGRELRSSLKRAGGDLNDFRDLNRRAAGLVMPVAKGRTPIGPGRRGHIRDSVRSSGTRTAAIVRAGNNTRFPYANPVHWGWVRRGIKPNPWVSRAAQETEPAFTELYFEGLELIIGKVRGI